MLPYKIKYTPFNKQWLVINIFTRLAQSSWLNRRDAERTMRKLNLVSK